MNKSGGKIEIDLTQLRPGELGLVETINGGQGVMRKLQSFGIRQGKRIVKVSSHFWRGPQTVEIGTMHIAIGFGMAKKIIVTVKR